MQTVWLARGPLQAAQWGLIVAGPQPVWIEQWRTWLPEFAAAGSSERLLSATQQRALWQKVVDTSPERSQLLDSVSVAQWAQQAWSLLQQYKVADPWVCGGGDDLRTLLGWGAAVQNELSARGWCTHDDVLRLLERMHGDGTLQRSSRHLVLLDIDDMTPLEQACVKLLRTAGWQIERRGMPDVEAKVDVRCADTQSDELSAALEWLLHRLARDPEQRVALITPQGFAANSSIRRRLAGQRSVAFSKGQQPLDSPAVAAAVNALQMLGPDGSANEFSAWLRSPFMQTQDPVSLGQAARAEIAERELLGAQLPLRLQQNELLARLAGVAENAAKKFVAAQNIEIQAQSVAPISTWIRLWQRQLDALGWMSGWPAAEQERAAQTLESGLDVLAGLAPMLDSISERRALAELRNLLSTPLVGSRMPVSGLHVLENIEDVGPGYSAVWAMGMSDAAWPRRSQPNPLLPLSLQTEAGMPWAAVAFHSEQAREAVVRLSGAVPELVFSWAVNSDSHTCGPAAAIASWLDDTRQISIPEPSEQRLAAFSLAAADTETVSETVGALSDKAVLRGGARLVNLQATCPLRAFIEFRLHASELPRRSRGISRALRGQLLHAAAARLLPSGTDQADLRHENRAARIAEAAASVLRSEFGSSAEWFSELLRFERLRVQRALAELTNADLQRGEFSVAGVERNASVNVHGVELRVRIDRLDNLHTGGIAVIDYKTGSGGATPYWFDAERADYQMPLYALACGEETAALALCSLLPDKSEYKGFWLDATTFPRKSMVAMDAAQWQAQVSEWQSEIEELIAEFLAGDDRIVAENSEFLLGSFAPLSRFPELQT